MSGPSPIARLFGSGVILWENFPVWQLREALEDDLAEAKGNCSPAEAVDNRVAVACEWLIQAGPALFKLCLLNRQDLDEGMRRSSGAGGLFSGNPGFNLEPWSFWKRRLGELRSVVGERVVSSVDRAVEGMKASEVALVKN